MFYMSRTLKACLGTKKPHENGLQRRNCRHCKAAYARGSRARGYKEKPRQLPKNQYSAKLAIYNAVRRGALPNVKTLACVDCNEPATVYEHRDYLKPLEVEPVCHRCNKHRGPALNVVSA